MRAGRKEVYNRAVPEPSRILIVDDDPGNAVVLSQHLRGKGYAVETAPDGEEAFVRLASETFDLVLLDLVMPGMTGFELLKQARTRFRVPIIVITGHADADLRRSALRLGAADLLGKPYDFDALDGAILRVLPPLPQT
ncbi:MAG TPA: response regulator [Elusimicrobia bacterium]|nr:response regulator [Elusimicrobiota bacterium]